MAHQQWFNTAMLLPALHFWSLSDFWQPWNLSKSSLSQGSVKAIPELSNLNKNSVPSGFEIHDWMVILTKKVCKNCSWVLENCTSSTVIWVRPRCNPLQITKPLMIYNQGALISHPCALMSPSALISHHFKFAQNHVQNLNPKVKKRSQQDY